MNSAATSSRRKVARVINSFPVPGAGVRATCLKSDFHEDVRKIADEADAKGNPQSRAEKVIVVGDHSVGKTSLVRRFCEGKFTDQYKATIGVDFIYQKYRILKQDFTLHIWDTAGQEQFRCISKAYFRGASGSILAFDLSSKESFDNTRAWLEEVLREVTPGHKVFLVGLKDDLPHAIDKAEARKMADELKAEYWEVSAKKDHNVNELFDRVAAALFEQSILKAEAKKNPTINLPSSSSSSRTDSAISDRYVEKSFESSKQNAAQATNQGYCCW
ncbi:RAB36 member RAS oncogene family protein [Acanthamoeba castellanii str. Neff]|uniref:RAB36 member RAS oncogene family protein n=1 Tax=Acanthamoeba castellanii (strain ATCC 30010 / Neff) TaxID=1257118 RepID=L8H339_ACACF|nr:RAB36 member RAS oncogene family protein [Acanthamoeba castellanii str. Neff]ELR19123.1 RAB36 member RAS oncogene family protein [Acanthamoeba castellanii str. Neff]